MAWWLIHDIDRLLWIAFGDSRFGCDALAEEGTQWGQVVVPVVSEICNEKIDTSSCVRWSLAIAGYPCVRFNNLPKFIDRSNASQLGCLDYCTHERQPNMPFNVA
jgi:hypothetical protein